MTCVDEPCGGRSEAGQPAVLPGQLDPYALLFLLVFGLAWADGTTPKCSHAPCLDRAVEIATASYGIRIALVVLAGFVASLVLHPLS